MSERQDTAANELRGGASIEPPHRAEVRSITVVKVLLWVAAAYVALNGVAVLMGAFAAVLLALLLGSIARWIEGLTRMPRSLAVTAAVILFTGVVALAAWQLGSEIVRQLDDLIDQLPDYVDRIETRLRGSEPGRVLLDRLTTEEGTRLATALVSEGTVLLTTLLSAVTNVLLVYAVGVFMAAQPRLYRDGALWLSPDRMQPLVEDLLDAWSHNLRWWLVAKVIVMVFIGVLTTTGLLLLGMPYALTLGMIAMLLSFVPYLGPLTSYVPAAVIALAQGGEYLLWVTVLYAGIQLFESYMITPMVQEKIVLLPPALTILFQVLVGLLLGIPGLLLSVPLLVVLVVGAKIVWVEGSLGRAVQVPGRS